MPSDRRDDADDERGRRPSDGRRRPSSGGREKRSGGRGGSSSDRSGGRSGAPSRRGSGRSSGGGGRGARRDDRDRDPRRRDDRDRREPKPRSADRPPVKGKRRRFDVESTPNERERGEDRPSRHDEQWIDEGPVRREAGDAVKRAGSREPAPAARRNGKTTGAKPSRRRAERATKRAAGALEVEPARLRKRLGPERADRTLKRLGQATAAYAEDRYEDARAIVKPIATLLPDEPAVRELHGLCLYRLGKWRPAIKELEDFVAQTRSTEQHPVLADCYRAVGQHDKVAELWEEMAEESLAAAVVAEGRIVHAGSLADQGRLVDAIAVLEAGALGSGRLKDHHLRMRYVLGDLYDRAGDRQAARRQFAAIAGTDPEYFDVRERLDQS